MLFRGYHISGNDESVTLDTAVGLLDDPVFRMALFAEVTKLVRIEIAKLRLFSEGAAICRWRSGYRRTLVGLKQLDDGVDRE
ncbi:hypothetical protein BRD16_05035 [Halobacteriales archaeon SW_6_65_46]|nr:MAG: hypothetical protein BRD16_05035 [Halobacteriales archaeon SW_6_65_46]